MANGSQAAPTPPVPKPNGAGQPQTKWSRWIAGGIGALFTAAVLASFWKIDFQFMANAEYARGVITLMITVAFIILGVLLIITALFGPFGDEQSNDTAFRRAREVFSTVVGIVGTIVGFYFGSSTSTTPIDLTWKVDGTKLIATVSGGKKPFKAVFTSEGKSKELSSEQNVFAIDACALNAPKSENNALEVFDSTQVGKKAHLGRILDEKVQCPTNARDQEAQPSPKQNADTKEKPKDSTPAANVTK